VTDRQQGADGVEPHLSGNLMAALFEHATSREKDPQLHTHAVILNSTQRQDGEWASIHSKPFFEHKMAAGNVYRAELAARVQALGYAIDKTHADGRFEIAAVPAELREIFQARRDQITAAMDQRGLTTAEDAAEMALRTRKAKQAQPREKLLAQWTEKAHAAGFDLAEMVSTARAAGAVQKAPLDAPAAVSAAVDRLAESEAVFRHAELLRWSLAGAMGQARIGDIEAAITQARDAGRLHETTLGGRRAWTTTAAKDQERKLLETARAGRNQVAAAYPVQELRPHLESSTLDPGQRAAVELIATSQDRFVGIQGRAGTGKTYMLGAARQHLEAKGFALRGMAQNSEAARRLQADSQIKSGTLRSHLNAVRKDLNRLASADKTQRAAIHSGYAKQVWVVDEAGQVGAGDMRRIAFAAERLGARVVLVGDTKQLGAIDAGKPFEQLLNDGMRHATLSQIRRQTDPRQLHAIGRVYAGDVPGALATLSPHIREIAGFGERTAAIVERWKALGEQRRGAYILTAGNQEKALLTEAVRQVLRDEKQLAGEQKQQQLVRIFSRSADRIEAGFYQVGDQVRFPRNLPSIGVSKGEYWRVSAVDRTTNQVHLEHADRRLDWNPKHLAGAGQHQVEIYRARQTTLAPGETIRWTRNSHEQGLTNGQRLTVEAVGEGRLALRSESGARVSIDAEKHSGQHWEHAYVGTVYGAQGATAQHVLVNAQSDQADLFNQKAFLVAISRQRETLTLFTDDKARLAQTLERHAGDKTSALEAHQLGEREVSPAQLQASLDRLEASYRQTVASLERDRRGRELER
jgi:ATP-dependent exoDNAse (exonuclease V) alpha subunit